jgi:predicted nucleic acid-binding Zn ribbon protein
MFIESIARWKYELSDMKQLVYLWELIRNRRLSLLGALMDREDNGIYITLGKRKDMIDDNSSPLARKWDMEGEQPLEAALQYLTTRINKKVTGSVFPTALPSYQKRVYLLPRNLMAGMWLMFLWEVIGEVRPHQCPGCGEWFDPRRSTRITCGDRCRKRISRKNRQKFQSAN